MLGKSGSGADVVSKGELKLALDAGIDPSKIVFSGVGKTKEEIIYALKKKIFKLMESEEELDEINALAINKKTLVNISLRVNLMLMQIRIKKFQQEDQMINSEYQYQRW